MPLNDYQRTGLNRYGTPQELQDSVQEMTLSQDKGFTMTIDKGNNADQMNVKDAGKALRRQIEEVIVPTVDKYRLTRYANGAGVVAGLEEAPTASNIVSILSEGVVALDKNLVPDSGRVIFLASTYYNLLRQSNEFLGLERLGERALAKGIVGEFNGMQVIKVPDSYLPEGVYFIICHKEALVSPVKLEEYKIHKDPPGINGNLIEGRLYFDAFILGAKSNGVYVAALEDNICESPAFTPAEGTVSPGTTTITISCDTEDAVMKYTLDGSDPKNSTSAITYTGPITTTGFSGSVTLRAFASADGLLPSGITTAVFKA